MAQLGCPTQLVPVVARIRVTVKSIVTATTKKTRPKKKKRKNEAVKDPKRILPVLVWIEAVAMITTTARLLLLLIDPVVIEKVVSETAAVDETENEREKAAVDI